MRVLARTEAPRPPSSGAGNAEDWLDQEIESLREQVETEAGGHEARERMAPAPPSPWQPLIVGAIQSAHRALFLPMVGLRRARRFVRTYRFDLVFYALGFGITMIGVGVVIWMSGR
jgi:hypothetical protein